MAIYDKESFFLDCKELLKNHLNTEITTINTEKNDRLAISHIKQENYILEPFNYEIMTEPTLSYSQPISAEIDSAEIKTGFSDSVEIDIKINILNNDSSTQAQEDNLVRLLRYQRAIYQAFANNQNRFRGYTRPEVFQIEEVFFTRNQNYLVRSAGVRLKSVLGNKIK